MFRAINKPILMSTDCAYSLWYNAPTMLPTGGLVEMEPHPDLVLAMNGHKNIKSRQSLPQRPGLTRYCILFPYTVHECASYFATLRREHCLLKNTLCGETISFFPFNLLFPFCFVSPLSILRSATRERKTRAVEKHIGEKFN